FNFIIFTIALNWESLTRGALGLPGIEKPNFFGFFIDKLHEIFIFYGLIAILSFLFLEKLTSSPIGRIIQALRDDELALASLGRDTTKIKNLILGLSGLFSALAGTLYAHYFTYLDPYSFGLGDLIFILSALFLGGLASNRGVLVGTLILLILPEVLRFFYLPSFLIGSLRQILYAVMLVSIIWFRPKGISGKIEI
ncbi:MAG: branched-chain amino acid ABC transporter permease, partial [Patescibacteria group bacterium]|nr:branched-chain amino acid ABC transporter permease [Patescibacteria group bacterium]